MISSRVEKLGFIVDEMRLCVSPHDAPDRPLRRAHARPPYSHQGGEFHRAFAGLRRPLNDAGYETRDFHKAKEAYASAFEEYFRVSRNRLGAHVQDFDFGKRIELWNEIEIVKISFFVDGAQEIYRSLALLNLPGYVAYADPPELTDPSSLRRFVSFSGPSTTVTGLKWELTRSP